MKPFAKTRKKVDRPSKRIVSSLLAGDAVPDVAIALFHIRIARSEQQ